MDLTPPISRRQPRRPSPARSNPSGFRYRPPRPRKRSRRMFDCTPAFLTGTGFSCRRELTGMPLRHRVIAAAAPRVTAQYPLETEPETFQRTVFAEGLQRILGAGGNKAAAGREKRRDRPPIKPEPGQEQPLQGWLSRGTSIPSFFISWTKLRSRSA